MVNLNTGLLRVKTELYPGAANLPPPPTFATPPPPPQPMYGLPTQSPYHHVVIQNNLDIKNDFDGEDDLEDDEEDDARSVTRF